jgi:DNA repair protein RadC
MQKFVDEILYVSKPEILEASMAQQNPSRRGRKPWRIQDEETFKPFDGFEGFLVRTALIRSSTYAHESSRAPIVRCSDDAAKMCNHLRTADQEHIVTISLGSRNQVLAIHSVGLGHKTGAPVAPADVAKVLLLTGGVGAVLLHNHPSGEPLPSGEDEKVAFEVRRSLECLGFTLLDFIIVGYDSIYSFLEHGLPPIGK